VSDPITDYVDSALNGEFSADQKLMIARLIEDFVADQLPVNRNDYRLAGLKFVRILFMIDSAMSQSRDPRREWHAIALGLGLPSVCFSGLTEAELARVCKRSRMAISLQIKKFLDRELEPAFGTGRYPGWRNQNNSNCESLSKNVRSFG
jgi:hypothetical protein